MITQGIIFSKMGFNAQEASHKVNELGETKLIGEEMLKFYKSPFAVNCNKNYFIALRQALEEHLAKLKAGNLSKIKQANALNLINIYQANIDSLTACRIELKEILPQNEMDLINVCQYR